MNRWFILWASLSCWLASSAVAYATALPDGAVVTFKTKDSAQCMGVDGAKTTKGARVGRFECGDDKAANQRWRVERQGDLHRFVNEKTKNQVVKMCLGVDGASTNVGAGIAQFGCDRKANQHWRLIGDRHLVREFRNGKSNHCLGVLNPERFARQVECNKGSGVIQEWRPVVR
jgi:hypothetical protein